MNIFTRKSHDQIHIDIVKSQLSCQMECFFCLVYRVFSSDDLQSFLIHGLWVYRNPCYRIFTDCLQLLACDAVRSAGFYCKFCQSLKSKGFSHCVQQLTDLVRKQCGRCTAADIDGIQLSALHHKRSLSYFFAESFYILISPFLPYFQRIRAERTVQADTRAEGNSDIKAVSVLIVNVLQYFSFSVCDCNGKCCFLRTHQIFLPHLLCHFRILHSGFDHSHCQLGRTDSGQVSPRKRSSCQLYQKLIQCIFNGIFVLFSQSMGIFYSAFCVLIHFFICDHFCGNHAFFLCHLFRQVLCSFVFYDIIVILPFHTEAEVILCFIVFIKSMDLRFGIKRFDQFINIMFKFSVLKQNAYFIQMDYTSFRNQWW